MFKRESILEVMGKRCRIASFCLALFVAVNSCFAAQTEPVTEKQKIRVRKSSVSRTSQRYPWKTSIVTTVFWIGEQPAGHNLTPNRTSSWDKQWTKSYGGFDDPNPAHRKNYTPVKFKPRQNPFYCALPYNDKAHTGHRPEAPRVVPWFNEAYQGPAVSTCKDRWIAIRKGNRIAYAQWEDAGGGAGLDVSPAVRDYLGLKQTDVTDWRFVNFSEVPRGPWSTLGENNAFLTDDQRNSVKLAERLRAKKESVIAP